ncbi:RNB domain-containing ribonuclease [Leekyejoonella antrihumi]|uniref:RNB domain-containing ribonuclease n=1 Tax=Leekyejoonella antrihumi TaxID=1660198 RepID=A0A563E359_9MICO|nr:RNB domain-containing ribonuclease [Leekyejoonella antrihumi]TWP36324.1 RNB domain-containing ribonuclease [Leekyejoonella antrihumi]
MLKRSIRAAAADASTVDGGSLEHAFAAIRKEMELSTDYPGVALAEAERAAAEVGLPARDETSVPFLTIDPAGSMDLDQAMCLERKGSGYRVRYAIADVPAYVRPGGALDAETWRRGQTVYLPDTRLPLHPAVLSDHAASLLPDQVRSAFVWDIALDRDGQHVGADVYRAAMRSRRRLDYEQVQETIDSGRADEAIVLLREIGELRIRLEQERGGASLPMPEQEVHKNGDGTYELGFRPPVASEEWNAQISLMTGMCAAEMMLHAQVGILRTMPPPDHQAVARFHRQAAALGVPWPAEQEYGDFIRGLNRGDPKHLALIHEATALFRGAGYTPFDGDVPEQVEQSAVAAPYAHVTAPLRRLVDRYGLAICEAVCRDAEIPVWVRQALPRLPEVMQRTDQGAARVEHACTDAVEAAVLQHRVGQIFDASVVDRREKGGLVVQLVDLAVTAECEGVAQLGERVRARLVSCDVEGRRVIFELA